MIPSEALSLWFTAVILGTFEPTAFIGAVAGSFFFLTIPTLANKCERFIKVMVSMTIGYSVGIAVELAHAMWAAILASSTGVLTLSGISKALESEEGVFDVLTKLADILKRFIK